MRNITNTAINRNISFSSLPRFVGRALRVPIAGVTVGGGSFAYANYKFEGGHTLSQYSPLIFPPEFRSKTANLVDDVSSGFTDAYLALRGTLPSADGFHERRERLNEWLSGFRGGGRGGGDDGSPSGSRSRNDKGDRNGNPDTPPNPALLAALALSPDDSNKVSNDDSQDSQPNLLMNLTRKLIEIRSILVSIDQSDNLNLPSIVVIGSQSSGKSSVLEAIVGHEFLPKGNNMVTRRPIELTLVHTPHSSEEYGEFPSLPSFGKVQDFAAIQKILTDQNLSVPASQCVSDKPIDLRIYSPHVPDLTLIDLPGYVQLSGMDQPDDLRESISSLCDKYIAPPNVILAVCAADVDLANSPALRASRRVDALGMRTVGVVTKLDMVTPDEGTAILTNRKYPLQLGYVGVVCKAPKRGIIDVLAGDSNGNMSGAIMQREENYFHNHSQSFSKPGVLVGTNTLRKKLMEVLERSMSDNLQDVSTAVQNELTDASYQFKVEYNDRRMSPESYVAQVVDGLKVGLRDGQLSFSKPQVREKLEGMLSDRVMYILEQLYWNDKRLAELNKLSQGEVDQYWTQKADAARSLLTKSGIGRDSSTLLADGLRGLVEVLTTDSPYSYHSEAAQRIREFSYEILRSRLSATSDQVENALKPFKFEVETEDKEWNMGRRHAISALDKEHEACNAKLSEIRQRVGGYRKLKSIISYIEQVEDGSITQKSGKEGEPAWKLAYNPAHLVEARQAMLLGERLAILKLRKSTLQSSQFSEKLAYTSSLFLQIELLQTFFDQFPREIDSRLMYDLDRQAISNFARENPSVRAHLDLQEKKDKLEDVMRSGTTMMQKVGQIERTNDSEWSELEARFKVYEKESTGLQKEAKGYLDSMRAMTAAQARIAETVESFYTDSNEEAMAGHAYKRAVEDLDTKTGRELDAPYRTTVLEPIQKLCAYFPNTNQAISKRHKKLLDYDAARTKVRKLTEKPSNDASALPRAQREMDMCENAYIALNDELKDIMPQMLDLRIPYLDPSFEAMVRLQSKFSQEGYEKLGGVQRYFTDNVRDDYANGSLDAEVENSLQEMKDLTIVGLS
ncbi:hypothetical protein E3P78_02629 [Wallemia ichthyophaga]|nr:hypothetical protein E3P78_02629 [Wallemia ichthyophaga]